MTLDVFEANAVGKKLDFDGKFGFQCMDLIEFYNRDVIGAPRLFGNAIDLLKNPQPNYYDVHDNGLTYIPPRGAIAVWNNKVGGGFGHVAIVLSADLFSFTCLEQDGLTQEGTKVSKYAYRNVQLFLVAKPGANTIPVTAAQQLLEEYKKKVSDARTIILEQLNKLN
jgi:hypothetical protein